MGRCCRGLPLPAQWAVFSVCVLVAPLLLAEALPALPAALPGLDEADAEPARFSEAEAASGRVPFAPVAPLGVLPAEFERQSALLLGSGQLADELPDVFARIVLLTRGRINLLALAQGEAGRGNARRVQVAPPSLLMAVHRRRGSFPSGAQWRREL